MDVFLCFVLFYFLCSKVGGAPILQCILGTTKTPPRTTPRHLTEGQTCYMGVDVLFYHFGPNVTSFCTFTLAIPIHKIIQGQGKRIFIVILFHTYTCNNRKFDPGPSFSVRKKGKKEKKNTIKYALYIKRSTLKQL